MASPVTMSELTFSWSTRRQTSWGSNLATRTILEPQKLWPITAHWLAPCMSGAMGRKHRAPPRPFSAISSGWRTLVLVTGSTPPPSA